jgi:hypothetical protein
MFDVQKKRKYDVVVCVVSGCGDVVGGEISMCYFADAVNLKPFRMNNYIKVLLVQLRRNGYRLI